MKYNYVGWNSVKFRVDDPKERVSINLEREFLPFPVYQNFFSDSK